MSDWEVPHGALDVAIPRTAGRILLQTLMVHAYATVNYVWLCEAVPRSRHKRFFELAVQAVILCNIPEFLLVQIISTAVGTLIEEFDLLSPSTQQQQQGTSLNLLVLRYAELVGLRSFKRRSHVADIRRSSWLRYVVVPQMTYGCFLGVLAYAERFRISYHSATDVGMLGIDHRNGWVAAVGILAGAINLFYRLYVRFATQEHGENDVGEQSYQVVREDDEEAKENALLAQDSSSDSLRHFLNFENKTVLAEAFVAAVIHQLPLAATHRQTGLFRSLLPIVILSIVLGAISTKQSNPGIARKAGSMLGLVAIVFITWTIVQTTTKDVNELRDVQMDKVYPWTMRWKVTDQFDRILRIFL